MQWSPSSISCSPFHGHVTEAALEGSDGGLARYRLVIEPWLSVLGHRIDAFVFQRKTVVQIVEAVFADYANQGKLAPAWRWDLADAAVYPERSLTIQYDESDLDFVQRLLREEGLFCWFEHAGNSSDPTLGVHTLVIADLKGPGMVEFRASAKELTGAGGASQSLELKKPGELKLCELRAAGAAAAGDSMVAAA
jgi:type VI secretion system secreted protein VgrG